jgi:hypothetical protein
MQIPIVSGIYSDNNAGLRTGYPLNYIVIPKSSGVSAEYLRPAYGIKNFATGIGNDRGGINWNGVLYRVSGNSLIKVSQSGQVTTLGTIAGSSPVTFDYSFNRLSISGGDNLYYYDGNSLTQVTDTDLGKVVDHTYLSGYFVTTDGVNLVVTELNDPTSINPLKYGSSEADPDPVVRVFRLRNELCAVNRHTIELFDNVGGSFFPFQRIEGAQIQKGALSTRCACVFMDTVAIVGGGRNEQPSIYLCQNSQTVKIADDEIDKIINSYQEQDLIDYCYLEQVNNDGHLFLYVHLKDKTLVYDANASQASGKPVWSILTSSLSGFSQYKIRSLVWCYNKWIGGDPSSNKIGYYVENESHHFGEKVKLEFTLPLIYNESKGALFYSMELVALTGNISLGVDAKISTSYSLDGKNWSQDRFVSAGKVGDNKRIMWLQCGHMKNYRTQRFTTNSDCHVSFLRLEANLEQLMC